MSQEDNNIGGELFEFISPLQSPPSLLTPAQQQGFFNPMLSQQQQSNFLASLSINVRELFSSIKNLQQQQQQFKPFIKQEDDHPFAMNPSSTEPSPFTPSALIDISPPNSNPMVFNSNTPNSIFDRFASAQDVLFNQPPKHQSTIGLQPSITPSLLQPSSTPQTISFQQVPNINLTNHHSQNDVIRLVQGYCLRC